MSELATSEVVHQRPAAAPREVLTMVLDGELGLSEIGDVSDMLFHLTLDDVRRVVLDLSGVTHLDFRGVKHLVRQAESYRLLGGDLKLAGLSPYLFAIFRSAGAHDAFDYFADPAAARLAFAPHRSPAQPERGRGPLP